MSRSHCVTTKNAALVAISPQNPLLHLQWNISASLTWHAAPFLQGFGWQGLLPHSPTPLPYRLSPPLSCRLSTRLLTSSMRMQPTRPVATAVLSLTLKWKKKEKGGNVMFSKSLQLQLLHYQPSVNNTELRIRSKLYTVYCIISSEFVQFLSSIKIRSIMEPPEFYWQYTDMILDSGRTVQFYNIRP